MKLACIFDTHARPGIDFSYCDHIGEWLLDEKPEVICHIGDHWDMPSLSSYDKGRSDFHSRRYKDDIAAGNEGMRRLLEPIKRYNRKMSAQKMKQYKPVMRYHMGNHEERIQRCIAENKVQLEGMIGYHDLALEDWEVYDFLQVSEFNGVYFAHYFQQGLMGRPPTTANAMLSKKHVSCIAGHQQGWQNASTYTGAGQQISAIICGSSYPQEENYLGAQGNNHWRGVAMLHFWGDGEFDIEQVHLNRLKKKYGANTN